MEHRLLSNSAIGSVGAYSKSVMSIIPRTATILWVSLVGLGCGSPGSASDPDAGQDGHDAGPSIIDAGSVKDAGTSSNLDFTWVPPPIHMSLEPEGDFATCTWANQCRGGEDGGIAVWLTEAQGAIPLTNAMTSALSDGTVAFTANYQGSSSIGGAVLADYSNGGSNIVVGLLGADGGLIWEHADGTTMPLHVGPWTVGAADNTVVLVGNTWGWPGTLPSTFGGGAFVDAGQTALFLSLFSEDGGLVRTAAIVGNGTIAPSQLSTANGLITVAGEVFGDGWDFGTGPRATLSSDGGAFVDAFVAQWQLDGSPVSITLLDQPVSLYSDAWADVQGVAVAEDGSVYLGESDWPQRLTKLTPTGGVEWQLDLGYTEGPYFWRVATHDNDVYVSGAFCDIEPMTLGGMTLQARGYYDVYLARLHPDGSLVWLRQFSSGGLQSPAALVVDSSGEIYVAGNTGPPEANWGSGQLHTDGLVTSFVARFAPDGTPIWSRTFIEATPTPLYNGPPNSSPNGATILEGLTVRGDGSVVVSGLFLGHVDLGFGMQSPPGWTAFFEALSP